MHDSRTQRSIKNSLFALLEQVVFSIMSFMCRTVFIDTMGRTYLGFSGLFNDIFTLLSLAELGAGVAILYSMYKPAAENDYKKIAALLNLYRRLYYILGTIITVAGLCLTPFLDFFVSGIPEMPELPLIYILYLLNTTASYFFIYKKSILIIDQKNFIASLVFIIVTSIQNVMQIIFLLATHSYIVYLLLMLCGTLANNLIVSVYVDSHYKYLKDYSKEIVDSNTKKSIFKNVRSMFLSKISSAIVTSTDNILISKYVGTIALGIYSNYALFTSMLRTVFTKLFEGITGSVGNLIATKSSEKVYDTFKKIWFVNFWLVSFCSSSLFVLINPFIKLWIGEDYLLDLGIVFMICFNFYTRFIRNTFITLTDTYGLFSEFRVKCVCEAVLNLFASLIFVRKMNMGIFGILLGTAVSNFFTNFWYEPYVIFCKQFKAPLRTYFRLYTIYLASTVFSAGVCYFMCSLIGSLSGWISFFLQMICCGITINAIYFVIYYRTDEFRHLISLIKNKFRRSRKT